MPAREPNVEESGTRKSRTAGLIWGVPKCGKTTFMLSLPGKKLFLMLDPDGDMSLPDRDDVFIIRLYEHDDDDIIHFLRKKLGTFLKENKDKFNSVIVDSFSTLNRIALNEAIRKDVGSGKDFKPTLEAPGLAGYGARTNYIVEIANVVLRATSVVGMHCWFTSHEDEPKTNAKGEMLYITMTLSGKSITGIGLNVSEIWYMNFHDKKWMIAIAPCRSRKPMGSRLFDVTGSAEFQLRFNPELGPDQPHSIAMWFKQWEEGGRKKLPLPK